MTGTSGVGLLLASAASITSVLMDVSHKYALAKNELVGTTFWIRLVAAFGFLLAFLWRLHTGHHALIHSSGPLFGIPAFNFAPTVVYLLYLLVDTMLVGLALLLYFRALQISDLSLCIPFLAFTPVFLLPSGYFLLHEFPGAGDILGALLVVIGSLLMNRRSFRDGFWGPIKAIFHQRGSRYMLLVAVMFSITNPIDKKAVLMSDPVTFALMYGVMLLFFYMVLMVIRGTPLTGALRRAPGWIIVAGLFDASALLLQFTSHDYTDVLVTITLKRAGVILTVLAGWLIFKERHIADRLLASGVMVAGVVLLCVPLALPIQLAIATGTLLLMTILLLLSPTVPAPAVRYPYANPASNLQVVFPPGGEASPILQSDENALISIARPLRCAFVGCGEVSQQYLRIYRELDWVQVVICVDTVIDRARQAATFLAQPGKNVAVSRSLADALVPGVDLVVLNTPNHLHREQTIASIEAGKHVFLQKPIASHVEDGKAMMLAARQANGRAGLYMSYFDQPLVHDLRAMTQAGWFGKITQMHARLMHPGGLSWSRRASQGSPSWRSSIEQTGGGAFIQLAVHSIRLFRWIAGEQPVRIHGMASNLHCPGLEGEDSAVALLQFESGAYATLNLSWCTNGEELTVCGTEGTMSYLDNRWLSLESSHAFRGHAIHYTPTAPSSYEHKPPHPGELQPFNQHKMFLEAVRDRRPPLVSFEDGLEDLATVTAFYKSIRKGTSVAIPGADLLALEMEMEMK